MSDDPEKNRARAIRWFEEDWNQRRDGAINGIEILEGPGCLDHEGPLSPGELDEVRRSLLGASSDLHVEVLDTVARIDKVVVRWRMTGTHDGDGLGVPPSGRDIDVLGQTWLQFDDGRMVAGWNSWDRGGLIAELMTAEVQELRTRHGLTRRQAQVALLMAERRTHKEIAKALDIRPNTARRHCQDVLRRLGVHRKGDVAGALRTVRG